MITITLNDDKAYTAIDKVNLILLSLSKQPFDKVFLLIEEIKKQADEQVAPIKEANPEVNGKPTKDKGVQRKLPSSNL